MYLCVYIAWYYYRMDALSMVSAKFVQALQKAPKMRRFPNSSDCLPKIVFYSERTCYLSHSYSIEHGTDYKIGLRLSVCQSISVCPSVSTLTVAFLHRLSPKLAKT